MGHNRSAHPQKTIQQGITLVEALIALLILTLGVLGLAQVEARLLVETRTTNSRATAIQLIADLRDRININIASMNAAGAQPVAPGALSPYADSAVPGTPGSFPLATSTLLSCNPVQTACTPTPQDLVSIWRLEVAGAPLYGRASIYQVSPHQLQVIVAWPLNENSNITLNGTHTAADQQLAAPLQITAADQTTNLCATPDSNNAWICHIDFIDIP
jgi:type IV pilus assembly protein PilV